MSDLRNRAARNLPRVSGRGLKLMSAILLLASNFGTIILEQGLIGVNGYTQEGLLSAMNASPRLSNLVGAASILQLVGGMAVPIFAFLLVEGFLHTKKYPRYLGAVSVTALVSELCYDYAMTGRALEFSSQNPMLGTALCLVMLYLMKMPTRLDRIEAGICRVLIALGMLVTALALRVHSGTVLVLLAACFYCLRDHPAAKTAAGVAVSLLDQPLAPMAFLALCLYNGQRNLRVPKYVFYALYPAQLLIMGVIARCFLR